MKSGRQSQHDFARIPSANIERSTFDRSHTVKTTFDSGYLIPVYADEVLPGDTFRLNLSAFARLATPLKPFMDNVYLDSFFFAVPLRLLWDNWERFNGAQDNPDDSTEFLTPVFNVGGGTAVPALNQPGGALCDYLGIPPNTTVAAGGTGSIPISCFWHRAYNLIWNSWFRDENLQDSAVVVKDDGPDDFADYPLLRRGKRHDYFTSCLPWPAKSADVLFPILQPGEFPISGIGMESTTAPSSSAFFYETDGEVHSYTNYWGPSVAPYIEAKADADPTSGYVPNVRFSLDEAVTSSINQLREAFQLQRLYERDARGGTRYTEIVRSHFGVVSPDARLQRPEYLGGGSTRINVHPLAQTSETATTPQGNLAAFATGSIHGHGFNKSFTEHCVILGMVSVRADLTYQNGLNRMFSRRTREEFYWPALSHLGEQEVLAKEINFLSGENQVTLDTVFGYQERYAEYRYKPSLITGLFRSTSGSGLDVWHLAQDFTTMPTLSPEFIEENPPISRVVATPSEPEFLMDAYFNLKCTRPMPVYSVPGLIDHF